MQIPWNAEYHATRTCVPSVWGRLVPGLSCGPAAYGGGGGGGVPFSLGSIGGGAGKGYGTGGGGGGGGSDGSADCRCWGYSGG